MHPAGSRATSSATGIDPNKARATFRNVVRKYAGFFLASLVLAGLHVGRLEHHDFLAQASAMADRWSQGQFLQCRADLESGRPSPPCPPEDPKREHSPQPGLEPFLFKSLTVVAISLLWFVTFQMKAYAILFVDKHKIDLGGLGPFARHLTRPWMGMLMAIVSSLPALLFAYAMGGAYEPAVFVMALVAIFVAAEHYVSLKENADRLDDTATAIDKSAATLGESVDEVKSMTGTLLNATGIREWRSRMYRQYREAKSRIDAVVRSFDIDARWWAAHESTCWTTYFEAASIPEGSVHPDTLLHTLTLCEAKVQFVADLPLPRPGGMTNEAAARYFRSLLGLAWTLVVFNEVAEARRDKHAKKPQQDEDAPYLRVRVSAAPAWIHVADHHTYQVIEKAKLAQSLVVKLDDDLPADSVEENRLSDWARRNVRQFAFRGAPAEEYLLSVIRWSMLGEEAIASNSRPIGQLDWDDALDKLGMDQYLCSAEGELEAPDHGSARAHCREAFREFVARYAPPGTKFSDLERRLL